MKLAALARRMAALLIVPVAASAAQEPTFEPPLVGSTMATVMPHVPSAAGDPCIVTLFQDQPVGEAIDSTPIVGQVRYNYTPPPGCQGPWAKVVLKVDVTESGTGPYYDSSKVYLRLGGVDLFEGSMTKLGTHPTWQGERDITDLSALLAEAHKGQFALIPETDMWPGNSQNASATLSARVYFYRASVATPAQKVPDAVFRVIPQDGQVTLPHNIVRAYLDIYNQEARWYTCVPDQELYPQSPFWSPLAMGGETKSGISVPGQGCGGGSFAQIEVSIDGTPAGVAPVFPLLSADLNFYYANTANAPEQPPQMLAYTPYRVDLTPFAAILNEAGEHSISLSRPANAYLLLYQDKGSNHVSGAVTLNTLAGSASAPTVVDGLQTNDDVRSGDVTTRLDRDFRIKGFVMTSHGRVDSSVHQTSHFSNTQQFFVDGLVFPNYRHYRQHLWIDSSTQQHSRRLRGNSVLDDDVLTASYPLDLLYDMDGYVFEDEVMLVQPSKGSATVAQQRNLDATYQHHGFGTYTSRVRESFNSSRTHDILHQQDSNWQSQAQYRFTDSQGSCYQSAMTALDGAVATQARGVGCGDHNHVRWHAHSDGSPDSLGWTH
ncbi:peptide-N4-asparagine amidase [Frateuria sp.]|uniref:peptide-N4-asparagine amidase n=1 Tax=Frateuria sp. TaxID=2211372 RepID=UPI003F813A2E